MLCIKSQPKTKKKKRKKLALRYFAGILVFFIFTPSLVDARLFNPNNIISDNDLFDSDSLSKTAIQKFLEREGSVLARYSQTVDGRTLSASEMIWEIGKKYGINPKFLLATLEKEQGLINKSQATEKALDWATGYSCYGGTCNEKHRGFYNQVAAAAETQKIYVQKKNQWSFQVGRTTTTFDDYQVTPENQATANLYVYTPYVGNAPELGIIQPFGANKLFWRIWNRYFASQKYLDGQILANNGNYYLIVDNQKRKFASKDIMLQDHSESEIINASVVDLNKYPNGPEIKFADDTLVKSSASGQIYLLENLTKRPVAESALALLSDFRLAVSTSEIPEVSEIDLAAYDPGEFITTTSVYPQGKLFKDPTGQIWLVKNGAKRKVDSLIWQQRFNSEPPEAISQAAIDGYAEEDAVKLKDGTFVQNSGRYYLISDGARMRIDDLGVFDRVFGINKKNNALSVSTAVLLVHSAGEMIDYIDDTLVDPITTSPTTPVITGNYAASLVDMSPQSLLMVGGQQQEVTLSFKNTGNSTWNSTNVWLEVADKGKEDNSFGVSEKINLDESSVAPGQVGNFTFTLTAPTDQIGILTEEFSLYSGNSNNKTQFASLGKFVIIRSGDSAQIVEHNIPVAVRNNWLPVDITMKIKNTSEDITWLSRRTALEIYNSDGSTSYFYDPNDWVREEVAAVPINQSTIAPGEIGEFKFTIDPRSIKPNTYIMNFKLRLLDKGKDIFLNGHDEWKREIRVD